MIWRHRWLIISKGLAELSFQILLLIPRNVNVDGPLHLSTRYVSCLSYIRDCRIFISLYRMTSDYFHHLPNSFPRNHPLMSLQYPMSSNTLYRMNKLVYIMRWYLDCPIHCVILNKTHELCPFERQFRSSSSLAVTTKAVHPSSCPVREYIVHRCLVSRITI